MTGTYVTFASGFGAARLTDERSGTLFAVYGPDVADGVSRADEFRRLWRKRALLAPEAPIFQQQPEVP